MRNRMIQSGSIIKGLCPVRTDERGIALIAALMILLMLTVIGTVAILTTSTEVKLSANERTTAQALQVAEAGIHHAMRILRGQDFSIVLNNFKHGPDDGVRGPVLSSVTNLFGEAGMKYEVYVRNNVGDGGANSTITDRDGRLILLSVATLPTGVTKTVEAEVKNSAFAFPVQYALGISGPWSKIRLGKGNATINGDLVEPGGSGQAGSACNDNKAAVAVDNMAAYEDVKVKKKSTDQITGIGLVPSVQLRPGDMSPNAIQALANDLAKGADNIFDINEKKAKLTYDEDLVWGSFENPQVTVIDFTGDKLKLKFNGNLKGYGILVINSGANKKSKVSFLGSFEWHGLIIVTGEAKMELKVSGNSAIYGGLVVANTNEDTSEEQFKFKDTGNSLIQYSCTAITKARQNASLNLNAWHELKKIGDSTISQL